jgi:DNA-binding CsgD family transcriptional regulator
MVSWLGGSVEGFVNAVRGRNRKARVEQGVSRNCLEWAARPQILGRFRPTCIYGECRTALLGEVVVIPKKLSISANFECQVPYYTATGFTVSKKSSPRESQELRQALVLATPECRIRFVDRAARCWLKQFFGRPSRAGLLPREVCRWLTHPDQKTSRSLLAKQRNARLYLQKQKPYTDHSTLLLLELIKGNGQERSRRHRDLTPREREVLFWLARGKSNGEIAAILCIRSATVGKHLERIYPKLGVENRTAAASFASEEVCKRFAIE